MRLIAMFMNATCSDGACEMEKRKTHTSTSVKYRYNKKVYGVVTVSVPKDIAKAFKEKCKADGVSQAQIVKRAIEAFLSQSK